MRKALEMSENIASEDSGSDPEESGPESEEVEEIENNVEQRVLNQSGTYRKGMKYNTLSEEQKDKLKKFFDDSDRFSDNEDEICEQVRISAERGRKWFCNHRYYTKFKLSFINYNSSTFHTYFWDDEHGVDNIP